jgi:hypothetical protein
MSTASHAPPLGASSSTSASKKNCLSTTVHFPTRPPTEDGRSDDRAPLRTVCADLSIGFERAVLRALAKRPEERYPTAGEFAAALRRSELR